MQEKQIYRISSFSQTDLEGLLEAGLPPEDGLKGLEAGLDGLEAGLDGLDGLNGLEAGLNGLEAGLEGLLVAAVNHSKSGFVDLGHGYILQKIILCSAQG